VYSVASGCEILLNEENDTSWSTKGRGAVLEDEALLLSGVDWDQQILTSVFNDNSPDV
jgi:hypothetical protein